MTNLLQTVLFEIVKWLLLIEIDEDVDCNDSAHEFDTFLNWLLLLNKGFTVLDDAHCGELDALLDEEDVDGIIVVCCSISA